MEELFQIFRQSKGVSIDTRSLEAGQIYFAFPGETVDGNTFVESAFDKGAIAAVCQRRDLAKDSRVILVEDTLKTLQDLAKYYRKQLRIPIIALTGSNGKTTNKELLKAILEKKYRVYATKGNFNNHIGVPLTILDISQNADLAIIEMGANHVGEIRELCEIAQPTHGYITNIGKAHLEGFGGMEGVRKGKSELFEFLLSTGGVFYYNDFEPSLHFLKDNIHLKAVSTIILNKAKHINLISLNPVRIDIGGVEIQSKLIGDHHYKNIIMNLGVGLDFGVGVERLKDAIEGFHAVGNRFEILHRGQTRIYLDAYNANPSSYKASIDAFLEHSDYPKKLFILGEMKELGSYAEREHQLLYNYVQELAPKSKIILFGDLFGHTKVSETNTQKFIHFNDLNTAFEKAIDIGCHIFIKGSRSNKLERLIK